jgi:hypothetical protein
VSGDWLALGAVSLLAAGGLAARRGSRAKLTPLQIGYVCTHDRPTLAQWLANANLDTLDQFIIDLEPFFLHRHLERGIARAGYMEQDRATWLGDFGNDEVLRLQWLRDIDLTPSEYEEHIEAIRHFLVQWFDNLDLDTISVTSLPVDAANCSVMFLDPSSMYGYTSHPTGWALLPVGPKLSAQWHRAAGSNPNRLSKYLVFYRRDTPPELYSQLVASDPYDAPDLPGQVILRFDPINLAGLTFLTGEGIGTVNAVITALREGPWSLSAKVYADAYGGSVAAARGVLNRWVERGWLACVPGTTPVQYSPVLDPPERRLTRAPMIQLPHPDEWYGWTPRRTLAGIKWVRVSVR